ncbi:MAG TPA: GntR family transcriptional regulator [Chloroflexota bacterium]|nr:GntR family transcriptional regulator [Chloroflexota bacterium]
MLDEKSPVPLYYQLQEIIRARIEGGNWQAGQQLPPESELCQEFGLSRGTVRQALADLVREGLLHRRRGKGSFVATPKIPQDLMTAATGFSEYAKQIIGSELGNRLLAVSVIPANSSLAEKLEIPEESSVVEIRKVKLAFGQPYFIASAYIPQSLCPGLENEDHNTGSLFDLCRSKYGLHVDKVKGCFEPVLVTDYEASLLEVEKGSPAMAYERIRYVAGDRPFMVTKHIIRGDMCRLTFMVHDNGEN